MAALIFDVDISFLSTVSACKYQRDDMLRIIVSVPYSMSRDSTTIRTQVIFGLNYKFGPSVLIGPKLLITQRIWP